VAVSLVYRSPIIYETVMRALYGRHYASRYRAIADLIPAESEVLDLCCGPAHLFHRYLSKKSVRYCGLDINARFIEGLVKTGATGQVWDLNDPRDLPAADDVVMQASLYHFLPDPSAIIDRMLRAAKRQIIVAEPIRNLADSGVPILSALARRYTDPGIGRQADRFTEATLDKFFSRYSDRISNSFLIPGGREKVYVLTP
jgi:ubiquinone/menaquinone biosynthesis C-methylase UbiE